MSKALVLGGTGFLGTALVAELARRGHDVVAVDNLSRGRLDADAREVFEKAGADFLQLDLTQADALVGLPDDCDDVYLLAGVVGVRYTIERPEHVLRTNGLIAVNVLDWWQSHPSARLLYASTSENYAGSTDAMADFPIPTPETIPLCITDILNPRFSYASSKIFGEALVNAYARSQGLHGVIIRHHNVFGPRMGYEHVVPELFLRLLRHEEPFVLYGHDQTRAFCYVDDAVEGMILALEKASPEPQVYHLGNDAEEIRIAELFERLQKVAGIRPERLVHEPAPRGSATRRCPDLSKARQELGYAPRVPLDEGLRRTFEWYSSHHPDGRKPR
jgi:UDP-glucose 4-epimerase/UDP-glucuronate decarboxylase